MAKSYIKLPNGTNIVVEGKAEEIAKILELYSSGAKRGHENVEQSDEREETPAGTKKQGGNYILDIVNVIKDCEESEAIEKNILDRPSLVNRILLPLYINHEKLDNKFALTTGEISKILTELSIPVSTSSISRSIIGPAKSYVSGDKIRKMGRVIKYQITRKGLNYLASVIKSRK